MLFRSLENRNVLLYGNFPVRIQKWLMDEEDRKVMYVGVTRAMERLVVLN